MTLILNVMVIYYIAALQRPHIELHHANQFTNRDSIAHTVHVSHEYELYIFHKNARSSSDGRSGH